MIMVYLVIVWVIAVLLILFTAYYLFAKVFFLRDPDRKIPGGENIVSPADGKVILVQEKTSEDISIKKGIGKFLTRTDEIGKKIIVISIFMSPFDVHLNRIPIQGRIVSIKHYPGKFYNAANLEKSLENERTEVLLDTKLGKVKVIQIAGFLARRIKCFKKNGSTVKKGERYGLINLGSQLTVIMPAEKVNVIAKVGEKVKAGSSVLAEIK